MRIYLYKMYVKTLEVMILNHLYRFEKIRFLLLFAYFYERIATLITLYT